MKRLLVSMIVFCSMVVLATSAWALYTVPGGVDVGDEDVLINSTKLPNSGLATEQAWITSVLGSSWLISDSDLGIGPSDALATNGTNVYAMSLPTAPTYFYVKTGNVDSGFDHFLYENKDNLAYGVVNIGAWGSNANVGKISHVGSVPEPTTLLLLGFGLVGLAGIGRKMKK